MDHESNKLMPWYAGFENATFDDLVADLQAAWSEIHLVTTEDLAVLAPQENAPPAPRVQLVVAALRTFLAPEGCRVGDIQWESSRKWLARRHATLVQDLEKMDLDDLPLRAVQSLRPYVYNPEFSHSEVAGHSRAAVPLVLGLVEDVDENAPGVVHLGECAVDG